ncbi:YbhB/YbcL family Raf kinase inhibitor-like protein [Streptomyces sp. NPDC101151]|uniref:YbhB/YbcL family Raf kinase inhibitor-like protein n=1 Tax=Streptomyces sp. NPDC101151 TaxID=3366115 RepID=UPI0037F65FCD
MRKGWVIAVVAATAVVSGCGDRSGSGSAPSPTTSHRLTVMSPAYADGGTIPRRYTCEGENVSPPLAVTGVPPQASSLAFLLQDPDAPRGTFTHWLVWDIDPHAGHLTAGEHPRGAAEGRNDFGRTGYGGPCPPRGDSPHRYVLTVYATDRRPDLTADATRADLLHALSGHTLATGTLTGRYGRQAD